jgi:protein-disulfide isomerase
LGEGKHVEMSDAGKRRREKAAAARATANAGEKRRERTVRIAGAATVVVVVAGIIGVALWAKNNDPSNQPIVTVEADPTAPVPSGVLPAGDPHEFGVPYGTAADQVPVLEIWEDFQCPACGALEKANGAGIAQLAEEGKVRLIWRPTTFLDRNLGNDASNRAVAAWGCAIDAGKAREYHDLLYGNQPVEEGTGWTAEELVALGEQAGMTGADLEKFTTCVGSDTYRVWGANSTQVFYDSGIQGTPHAKLNGEVLAVEILADPEQLAQTVATASAK